MRDFQNRALGCIYTAGIIRDDYSCDYRGGKLFLADSQRY